MTEQIEKPDTPTMQKAVDALRGLIGSTRSQQYRDATVRMAADIMELGIDQIDLLYRLLVELQKSLDEGEGDS
jgi:hypothetical protein